MKFDFSAQFLRINPPDTSFGDAWESLCYALLDAELNDSSLIRLRPPDKGVDILHRNAQRAFQCKSNEQGAFGSLSSTESIKSLNSAFAEKAKLSWEAFAFATNANYTGSAFTSIIDAANKLGLNEKQIEFLGPEHWDKLCIRHENLISDRFDYRIPVAKERVTQAFANQRYFPQYVSQYTSEVKNSSLVMRISNNRTPAILEIPFSPELTVEHLVDVVKDLLGVSLEWTNYQDLGTSAGPSISLTLDKKKQSFNKKIGELNLGQENELEFWITIVWRDEEKKDATESKTHMERFNLEYLSEFKTTSRSSISYGERREKTISRSEEIIENMLWNGVRQIQIG
ncbi:hypothetical protein [Thiothrix unzii]|uniref:Uncharacterized protein n=1 Tax=Thiothrix unzii TaxID=111769 RepID=A0A975F776_9GAMM|nr:hypothetical protein [Thiothrix unzii]QTR52209.1 hypothetical protein J9260_10695 [Thiothrix unzii]